MSVAEPLREAADVARVWPAWYIKLAMRLAQLQRGQAYTLTIVLSGDEPIWTVQPLGKLENDR